MGEFLNTCSPCICSRLAPGSDAKLFIIGEKGRAQLVRGEIVQKVASVTVDAFKPKDGLSFASVCSPALGKHPSASTKLRPARSPLDVPSGALMPPSRS